MFAKSSMALGLAAIISLGTYTGLMGQEESAGGAMAQAAPNVQQSKDDINRAKLQEEVTLDYDETPFVDIMEEIRAEHGINILLDQSARDDSLSEDELVTFKVKGVEMGTALQLMLNDHNSTFLVRDEVLRIISKDVAGDPEFFNLRMINCRRLLGQIRDAERSRLNDITRIYQVNNSPKTERPSQGGGFGGGGRAGGGGVFNLQSGDKTEGLVDQNGQIDKEAQAKVWFVVERNSTPETMLIDAIKTSVAPQDWDDTNGEGTIHIIGGSLIIQQTEVTIKQVEQFMNQLSASMAQE